MDGFIHRIIILSQEYKINQHTSNKIMITTTKRAVTLVLAAMVLPFSHVEARLGDGAVQNTQEQHRQLSCTIAGYCGGYTFCCSGYRCVSGHCFSNTRMLEEEPEAENTENVQEAGGNKDRHLLRPETNNENLLSAETEATLEEAHGPSRALL